MLLDIQNLNLSFHTDNGYQQPVEKQVLFDVSLTVEKGETVALVGESGSGKSVTALSILRLLEESSHISHRGSIQFNNKDIYALNHRELRQLRGNQIAMIFQEPMTSLNPVYSIGNQLMEPLRQHRNMNKKEAAAEAIRLLDKTGIKNSASRLHSYPHQLSGGQRQRVMIAMALACKPQLLIADEPTTALDVSIQAQILALIKDLQQEFEMALLLITHDLGMVRSISDHIHIMHNGRVVENGKTEDIFLRPQNSYTKHLMNAVPTPRQETKGSGEILLETNELCCHFPQAGGFRSLFKRTKSYVKAVDKVDLHIHKGTTCGVVGESGSGKTTLGMALLKLIDSTGEIQFNGQDIQNLPTKALRPLRKDLQVVFQDPFSSLSPRLTVGQIVAEGMTVHGIGKSKRHRHEIIAKTLEEVGLDHDAIYRYPHEFSGGQRQRIAIARAIVLHPQFLILDEPTSALDMTIQQQVLSLLKALQKRYNLTYLFISHDLRVIQSVADYVIVMKEGIIVENGSSKTIFANPQHPYTKNLFNASLS